MSFIILHGTKENVNNLTHINTLTHVAIENSRFFSAAVDTA